MIIVVFRCVIACIGREKVEVGKMSATVMQMQLHTNCKQGIYTECRYEEQSLHTSEDTTNSVETPCSVRSQKQSNTGCLTACVAAAQREMNSRASLCC